MVMLKLTLPEQDNFYADFVKHPKVLRVVALSGGYSRDEANSRLRRNHGVVASFSRALAEGLSAQQSAAEFNATLDKSIQSIFRGIQHLADPNENRGGIAINKGRRNKLCKSE